ncbi:hypothetical protein CNECB9_3480091 [Cupriavidus necator]|uniref:Uncharacterized protein n=1 Tax=Cupriavidus necator TaxID=106590 RepID=A0A1K0JPC8_CUPNE|nr:hypothetical protein CNECB9_3480091 [Cupriavidus necator]
MWRAGVLPHILGACDDCLQTTAAYRFRANEQIDWRDVMQPIGAHGGAAEEESWTR